MSFKSFEERRKHKRFPVIKDLAEPIEVLLPGHKPPTLPGIMTNLSAGGVDLILVGLIDSKTQVQMTLHNVPGLERLKVGGRIVWTRPKGGTTLVGIQFTEIQPKQRDRINSMAQAYWECEGRIDRGDFEICFRECTYWSLCRKTVKLQA